MRMVKSAVIEGLPREIGEEVDVDSDTIARFGDSYFSEKLMPIGTEENPVTPEEIKEFEDEFYQLVDDTQDAEIKKLIMSEFKNGVDSESIANRFSADRIAEAAKELGATADMEKLTDKPITEIDKIKESVGTENSIPGLGEAFTYSDEPEGTDDTGGTEETEKTEDTKESGDPAQLIEDVRNGSALATLNVKYNKPVFIAAAASLGLTIDGDTVNEIYTKLLEAVANQ